MGAERLRANLLPAVDARLHPFIIAVVLPPVLWRWGRPEPSRRAIAPVAFPPLAPIVKKNYVY